MNIKIPSIALIVFALCACSNQEKKENILYVDSSCTAFQPIITHNKDADLMDVRTVREINSHNAVWDRLCGDKK